ncbi:hypothetical protein BY458DRAFT_500534 [Sporodiniella umbellata]|nr:hypothetical protein BY458DRAFT_500534 [Sporodiniella umbellata]
MEYYNYDRYYYPCYDYNLQRSLPKNTELMLNSGLSQEIELNYTSKKSDIIEEFKGIDPNHNEHLDGEPMNDLELLAAKNAIINSKMGRVDYKRPEHTSSVPTSTPITDRNHLESKKTLTQKKKRWPLGLWFNKPSLKDHQHNHEALASSKNINTVHYTSPLPVPTHTSMTVPTPPRYQIFSQGNWVFRCPGATYWIRFDIINQQKITYHVHTNNRGILHILDTHLCNGQLPVLVQPFQRICYYALDRRVSQVGCLQLAYVSNQLS